MSRVDHVGRSVHLENVTNTVTYICLCSKVHLSVNAYRKAYQRTKWKFSSDGTRCKSRFTASHRILSHDTKEILTPANIRPGKLNTIAMYSDCTTIVYACQSYPSKSLPAV